MDLNWLWWAAPLAVAAFGLLLLVTGIVNLFRGQPFKGGRGMLGGVVFAAVGLAAALIALNAQVFARLDQETDLANISVKQVADGKFELAVERLDGRGGTTTCTLEGDAFLAGGKFVKLKGWAVAYLGLDNESYQLDRMINLSDQTSPYTTTPCVLPEGAAPEVNKYVPVQLREWLLNSALGHAVEDSRFRNFVGCDLVDGGEYTVKRTEDAFIIEVRKGAEGGAKCTDVPAPQ